MAAAHGVDIEALHQPDVLEHQGGAESAARIGVMLVTVDPFDLHGDAIDGEDAPLPLDFTEPDARGGSFLHGPALVLRATITV